MDNDNILETAFRNPNGYGYKIYMCTWSDIIYYLNTGNMPANFVGSIGPDYSNCDIPDT